MSAPQAQRQVPVPVQSIQPCNHATFPRAIRRGAEEVVPDDRPEWPLQVHSYGARDLLNKTVAGFLHDKLTARQKAAQDGFHKRFKDGSSMAAILDTMPALAGKSPPLDTLLRDLMRFLDDRFFFGRGYQLCSYSQDIRIWASERRASWVTHVRKGRTLS
ncbi:hypothetical protein COL26b_002557 [Colletotrichum chrysophilum]|uniref:uncharacterized protein n=1 Tax=Colletotrichum chrysophilum TaxID=1836956 RepID=UPI0022FFD214|nr:uncharacterized protein COL26b_002557 [Colletotrichum chrysophilum]KAJ0379082.1 hypothetical protein COL26b_002557 [Colletotrichum chrysophilum]